MVVYSSTSYIDKRLARKKKMKRYGALVLGWLCLLGAAYLVFVTDTFRFREVSAGGDAAKEIFWFPQHPFFWQSLQIVNPRLALISVRKNFLSRTITLSAEAREKYGVWCAAGTAIKEDASGASRCFWFDRKGVLFREAPTVSGTLIPKINEVSSRDLKIGNAIFNDETREYVLHIFEIFQKAQVALLDLKIENLESQEITAELLHNVPAYFSLRFDSSFAVPALLELKPKLATLSYIDFRSQNRVYYR